MTLQQIKEAVKNGQTVYWKNSLYRVVHTPRINQWLIICDWNESAIGLTWTDGVTLNGDEKDFFVKGEK